MNEVWRFNMDTEWPETIESLIARRASLCDLLKAGALRGEVVRGSLKLTDGTVKLCTLSGLLKAHGCKFDAATKTWRRASATTAERYAVGVLNAREATQAVKANNDVIDAIFAQVDAADALRRQCTWVGMPLAPRAEITPEVRAAAWARHGLT